MVLLMLVAVANRNRSISLRRAHGGGTGDGSCGCPGADFRDSTWDRLRYWHAEEIAHSTAPGGETEGAELLAPDFALTLLRGDETLGRTDSQDFRDEY